MGRYPHAASTLSAVLGTCSPKPLAGENLVNFWVETQEARDDLMAFRNNLEDALIPAGAPALLVAGHRGCGKSTELNKFVSDLPRDRWLVVQVKAGEFLPVGGNEAADVLLAICVRLIEVVQEHELGLNEESLKPVFNYFETVTTTTESSGNTTKGVSGGMNVGESWLGKLVGLKGGVELDLKYGSRETTSRVARLRQRKGELAAAVKTLFIAAELAWRRQSKSDPSNRRILLVVEDLDKFGLQDARRIFVEDGRLLAEVGVPSIFTIPIFAFSSPDAGAIGGYGFVVTRLPMIKVVNEDGTPSEKGRAALREIVRTRVDSSVLPDDAMELLISQTGGVLRDVFEAIQTAAQFLPVKKSGVIELRFIEEALRRMQTSIGLRIAYPPDAQGMLRNSESLQKKLALLAKTNASPGDGHAPLAQADPDLQLLLMSGALLEYNGIGWLRVHPLARGYLKKLGHDVGP